GSRAQRLARTRRVGARARSRRPYACASRARLWARETLLSCGRTLVFAQDYVVVERRVELIELELCASRPSSSASACVSRHYSGSSCSHYFSVMLTSDDQHQHSAGADTLGAGRVLPVPVVNRPAE